jgi:uncharacterized protein YjgD (DUF1641 family)
MEIVSINSAADKLKKQKADLLEVLDTMRSMVESGELDEFVAASINADGDVQLHATCKDLLGGIGLFEIGKKMLIEQQQIK